MKKIASLTTIAALSLIASGAFAATQIQGVDAYVTGDAFLGGFSPSTGLGPGGTAAELQLLDDGNGADAAADDGTFTAQITMTPSSENISFIYKVASSGFGPVNTPDSGFDNLRGLSGADGTTIEFYIDTVVDEPGFVPEALAGVYADGLVYSSVIRDAVDAAASVKVTGTFQSQLGGTDFDPTTTGAIILTDPDTDGRYTGTVTGLTPSTYTYKIVLDDDFAPANFGTLGYTDAGGNSDLNFTTTSAGDTITITLDSNKGRTKSEGAAPIPAGFYAQSSAWSTGYSAAEELGAPTGGVYQKVFSVATAGDYSVRVRDENTDAIPDTGNIPFTTTTSPQDVVVIYDTNTYGDGYQPAGNFVLILDDATRTPLYQLSNVQVVGQFQGDFSGASAPFTVPDANFDMTETAPGTYLYTFQTPNTATATGSADQYKAVGVRTGSTDSGFAFQLGGAVDNITITGNNESATNMIYTAGQPLSFKLDAATGRILGVAGSTLPADPTRPSYLSLSGNVSDWSQY